ncbi:MAG: response regulator [Vicinamibacterales bacterium]
MPDFPWLAAVYVGQAAGAALVCLLCVLLYARAGRPFLLDWATSWGALAVFILAGVSAVALSPLLPPGHAARILPTAAATGAKWTQLVWLLVGTRLLAGRPTRLRRFAWPLTGAIWLAATGLVLVTASLPLAPRYLLILAFPQAAAALAFGWAAVVVARHAPGRGGGRLVLAAVLGMYALLELRGLFGGLQALATGGPLDDPMVLGIVALCLHGAAAVAIAALVVDEEAQRRRDAVDRERGLLASLRLGTARERAVLDQVDEIVYRLAPRGDGDAATWWLTFLNPMAETRLGIQARELTAAEWTELAHPDDRARLAASTLQIVQGHTEVSRAYRLVHPATRDVRWLEERVLPAPDAEGGPPAFYAVARDVTALQAAEQAIREGQAQLAHADRLDAVGRLAGALAQDFNNLLTTITGYAALIRQAVPPASPAGRDAEGLLRAAAHAAELTRQLQTFGARPAADGQPVDLNTIVGTVAPMMARLLSARVALDTVLAPGLPRVQADRGALEQALLHLAASARPDAAGARVTLSTRSADGVDTDGLGDGLEHDWVTLEVAGQGASLDAATLAELLEPLGTGMARRARIQIRQANDAGFAVTVLLPAAGLPPDETAASPVDGQDATGAVVLVVEDDEAVRELVVDVLARDGYEIIQADSGQAALAELERQRRQIDLVLTDVVMPGMSGTQLVRRITARRSTIPVLYMTGYADPNPADAAALAAAPVLHKPFTPSALSEAVRKALRAGR